MTLLFKNSEKVQREVEAVNEEYGKLGHKVKLQLGQTEDTVFIEEKYFNGKKTVLAKYAVYHKTIEGLATALRDIEWHKQSIKDIKENGKEVEKDYVVYHD